MKFSIYLFVLAMVCAPVSNTAQECIDPSLIDPLAICGFIWDPVCGCNGITYGNSCEAENFGGVTSWTPGECSGSGDCIDPSLIDPTQICNLIWDPVCGCNGVTYSNDCVATYSAGITSWTSGECGSGGGDCIDPALIDPDAICITLWDPVCGCDGVTYGNSCQATNYGGVTSWVEGECPGSSNCDDLGGIGFGPCDAIVGWAIVNGECTEVSGCGPISGEVDYSNSFYSTSQACMVSCGAPGDCMDLGGVDFGDCEMIMGYALINGTCQLISGCGWTVDFIDYSPWSYETAEACAACEPEPVGCLDLAGVDFGDCDFVLGIANINGECVSVSGCDWTVDEVDYSPYFSESIEACQINCADYNCQQPDLIDTTTECISFGNVVCGCDSLLYWSACEALYYNGIASWENGVCQNPAVCVDESQIDLTVPCPLGLDPVCGCDSVTYGNSCEAYFYGGVQSWAPGSCPSDSGMAVIDLLDLQLAIVPNPVQNELRLLGGLGASFDYRVLETSGRMLMQGRFTAEQRSIIVTDLPQGVYLLEIQQGMGNSAIRFIKD